MKIKKRVDWSDIILGMVIVFKYKILNVKNKMYKCEVEGCDREVSIRSTIKNGENKGLKACTGCKQIHDGKQVKRKALKPFTEKTKKKRMQERSGLPKFFEDAIEELKTSPFCVNCGGRINVNYEPVRNVAHVLPKSIYKSVMAHPDNRIFLCSDKDMNGKDCHYIFDNEIEQIEDMECFEKALEKFEKIKNIVTERGKVFRIYDNRK